MFLVFLKWIETKAGAQIKGIKKKYSPGFTHNQWRPINRGRWGTAPPVSLEEEDKKHIK